MYCKLFSNLNCRCSPELHLSSENLLVRKIKWAVLAEWQARKAYRLSSPPLVELTGWDSYHHFPLWNATLGLLRSSKQLSGTYHSPETLPLQRVKFPRALVLSPQTQFSNHIQSLRELDVALILCCCSMGYN